MIRPRRTLISKTNKKLYSSKSSLPQRLSALVGILILSRAGTYIPLSPQIDIKAFSETFISGTSPMNYMDILTSGSMNKVGVFSLGIVPYINASIIMQLLTSVLPQLKKLQMDGPLGRQRFTQYQKAITLIFALIQALGLLNYLGPFVTDFNAIWLLENTVVLATGAMLLTFLSSVVDQIQLGNGTSILIFINILSSLTGSLPSKSFIIDEDLLSIRLVGILGAFLFTLIGIVYVQEAERKIPINYATRYSKRDGFEMTSTSYLPFKVNATGVMPIILSSSILSLPITISRFYRNDFFQKLALNLSPSSPFYLPYTVGLIFLFNYFYTLLQFQPKEVADNLKKAGASIPNTRPGLATSEFLEGTLSRMSVLGSAFLGLLALVPNISAALVGHSDIGGSFGTSTLILVGVATDFAARLRAEIIVEEYQNRDDIMIK
jgi:preprotein translocase SecY subunit